MKIGKRMISLLLLGMMLSACSCWSWAAAAVLSGSRLDARAYTFETLDGAGNDMLKLNDGNMDGAVVVMKNKTADLSDNSCYIDFVFNGYMATVESFDFGCNEGLIDDMAVTEIGIAAYDDAARSWPEGPAESHVVNWQKADGAYTGKAVVIPDAPITASRIRIYIKGANRTYNMFRMEELAPFGTMGSKTNSLSQHAAVTADFDCEGNFPLSNLTDGNYASEALSNFQATAEQPGIITMDFGSQFYQLDEMELVTLFAKSAGVKAMDIEYMRGGRWAPLKSVTFDRPNGNGTTNSEIDRIALDVITNQIRFCITDFYHGFGHFRISELALYGAEAEEPVLPVNPAVAAPLTRQIVQRDGDDRGSIPLTGTVSGGADGVKARLVERNRGAEGAWQSFEVTDGSFSGTLTAGVGWYDVELCAMNGESILDEARVERVGVGDVFITAGQENACSFGETRMTPGSDFVSAYDPNTGKWVFAADPQPVLEDGTDSVEPERRALGSVWPVMADEYIRQTGVPVGLYSTGRGSSTIEMWQPSYPSDPGEGGNSQNLLYKRLRQAIETLRPTGFKAILWHQGESDAAKGTAGTQYEEKLKNIINQSRIDAGFAVPWLVSEASYSPDASESSVEELAQAQRNVAASVDGVYAGPDTNAFRDGYRSDGLNMNMAGQLAAGREWVKKLLAAFDMDQPYPIDPVAPQKLLDTVYLTTAPLDPNYSDLSRLNNQSASANEPVVVNVGKTVELGRDYFFDAVFMGKAARPQSIRLECNQQFLKQQSVKALDIDWYDAAAGAWKPALADYAVQWERTDAAEGVAKATVMLPEGLVTERIRIYIRDANREWDNFRIEEMAVFGGVDAPGANLARDAEITVGYGFDPVYYAASDLTDGDFSTKLTSGDGVAPSAGNPADITFDFGERYFQIDELSLVTAYARYCGVTGMEIQCRQYGEWNTLKSVSFTRGQNQASQLFEIDDVPLDVLTNGIRLRITDVILDQTYHNFSINELILRGTAAEAPPEAENIRLTAAEGMEALVDGNPGTGWTSAAGVPTEQSPVEIALSFARRFLPVAVTLTADGAGPTMVQLGYRSAEGAFVALTPNTALAYQNGRAAVMLDGTVETDNLVIRVTDAPTAAFTLSEVNVSAIDPYYETARKIERFLSAKRYADYEAAWTAVEAIEDPAASSELSARLAAARQLAVSSQTIAASYDVAGGTAKITGWLFAPEGLQAAILVKKDAFERTAAATVDENGGIAAAVDLSDITTHGSYSVSTVVDGITVSAQFETRAQKTGHDILAFSIDGASGVISGSSVTVTLPRGSSLTGRVPVFTLSEGAALLYQGTEIQSGTARISFANPVVVSVRAENGSTSDYTITAYLPEEPGGGSSGGGGGSSGGGGKISLPAASGVPNGTNQPGNRPPEEQKEFEDVPPEHWAYPYVTALAKMGVVNGVDEARFQPDGLVKREEFVKMLAVLRKLPEGGASAFLDAQGSWCEPYIAAAVSAGLVNGLDAKRFGVGEELSRQDLAVMLYRALPEEKKAEGIDGAPPFADDTGIADYARQAVYTLRGLGILSGVDGSFEPNRSATRAETAKILAAGMDLLGA